MINKTINIWKKEEYSYEGAYGFEPNLHAYVHEEASDDRATIIVVPGGAYRYCSNSEGENVALAFYEMNFDAFVLSYTCNPLLNHPIRNQALNDISRAVRLVRQQTNGKVFILGFSAGGHLCASLLVHRADAIEPDLRLVDISNKPDGAILCYPVITSGEYSHFGSIQSLYGLEPNKEELEYSSLEKHVTSDCPPCFVWQTRTDAAVPVENSYMFCEALKKAGVPFAQHVFSDGHHGLSLANEQWARGDVGGEYTMDQIVKAKNAVDSGEVVVDDSVSEFVHGNDPILRAQRKVESEEPTYPEIMIWPILVAVWIKETF